MKAPRPRSPCLTNCPMKLDASPWCRPMSCMSTNIQCHTWFCQCHSWLQTSHVMPSFHAMSRTRAIIHCHFNMLSIVMHIPLFIIHTTSNTISSMLIETICMGHVVGEVLSWIGNCWEILWIFPSFHREKVGSFIVKNIWESPIKNGPYYRSKMHT